MALALLVMATPAAMSQDSASAPPARVPVLSGYKFVPLGLNPEDPVLRVPESPRHATLLQDPEVLPSEGRRAVTWAFAVGECGSETIGGIPGERIAEVNRTGFEAVDVDFIVSTGGQGGVFTCATEAGMERFHAHYDSPRLLGYDFDIEAGQAPEVVDALLRQIAGLQRRHPALRISFTLPTLAATDGSGQALTADGLRVVTRARELGVPDFLVNLMVMDYGDAKDANCVVADGRCDMGASAIQAARNLHVQAAFAFDHMEITPMIGVNDSPGNVVRLPDAVRMARFVRNHGLAGLHYWSMDRDRPCAATEARNDCSGVPEAPRGAFAQAFAVGLRRH